MAWWEACLVAVALGVDAMTVSLAISTRGVDRRQAAHLAMHFGLFQFGMPLIGWQLGRGLMTFITAYDHWIAFGLLSVIGIHMIIESFRPPHLRPPKDLTCGWTLTVLSVATSMDALGVGLGIGVLGRPLFVPALIIGAVAAAMTLLGAEIGNRLSVKFGQRMETLGGLILLAIAFRLLAV